MEMTIEAICSARKERLSFREGMFWTFVGDCSLIVGPAFKTEAEADAWRAPLQAKLAAIEEAKAAEHAALAQASDQS